MAAWLPQRGRQVEGPDLVVKVSARFLSWVKTAIYDTMPVLPALDGLLRRKIMGVSRHLLGIEGRWERAQE
jgi:hypothetical protein